MFVSHLCSRFKSLILTIIGVFRRALCCFSRRKSFSSHDNDVLETVNVVTQRNYSPGRKNELERDWNTWDDSPRTVEEHIEAYRKKLVQKESELNEEQAIDFFGDMEPKVVKQTKILIRTSNQEPADFSRLKASANADVPIPTELEDWEDESKVGWEEITKENTTQLIREKRKELRAHRMTKQKDNYHNQSGPFGERIGLQQS